MKFINIAMVALLAEVQSVKYAESEGPTKVDLGEADETVLKRERVEDPEEAYENPLSWHDDGADDDTVITQLRSHIHMGHRHHHKHHSHAKAAAYRKRNDRFRVSKARDAYDGDPTTTSPYDDMYQHKYADWGVPQGQPGSKGAWGTYHGTWTSGVGGL